MVWRGMAYFAPNSTFQEMPLIFLALLDPSQDPQDSLRDAVARFQRGDDREAAFQVVVERFFRPVQGFFARRVSSPDDRLDLTQETFLRAYQSLDRFRGESKLSTWLFRIAYYTYRHWMNTGMVKAAVIPISPVDGADEQEGPRRVPVSEAPDAAARLLKKEEGRLLSQAIRGLPPKMRQSVTLRVYRDLSYREIAEEMGISIQTVKAHLFQAKQQLRTALDDHFEEVNL